MPSRTSADQPSRLKFQFRVKFSKTAFASESFRFPNCSDQEPGWNHEVAPLSCGNDPQIRWKLHPTPHPAFCRGCSCRLKFIENQFEEYRIISVDPAKLRCVITDIRVWDAENAPPLVFETLTISETSHILRGGCLARSAGNLILQLWGQKLVDGHRLSWRRIVADLIDQAVLAC